MKKNFRLAMCQMRVGEIKQKNIENAVRMIREAVDHKADISVLPEMFNCPYDNTMFRSFAEKQEGGSTLNTMSKLAIELKTYIICGSIPESDGDKIYNTSYFLDKKGMVIGKYRKIHLFDIDIKDKIRFVESDVLTPGNEITVVDTEFCKIGIGICYDIRFPEMSRHMVLEGAELLVYPGAFNMTTGPMHWELHTRARAVDEQCYVAVISPARDLTSKYTAFGHSMLADPWGRVIVKAGEKEEIIYACCEKNKIEEVRTQLPLLKHRRPELY